MRYLTIALSKGRIADYTIKMLESAEIHTGILKNSRKLIFTNNELNFKFILVKASDVPTYVEQGVADLGIVGSDNLLEEDKNICELLDLKFGKCKIIVAAKKGFDEQAYKKNNIRVATKYPFITKNFFHNVKKQTIEIIKLNGSVELAPIVGLADVIVDIVETGSTLKENDLIIIDHICDLSARLIANRASLRLNNERIRNLTKLLKSKTECGMND